jgi:hypothetical protein
MRFNQAKKGSPVTTIKLISPSMDADYNLDYSALKRFDAYLKDGEASNMQRLHLSALGSNNTHNRDSEIVRVEAATESTTS